MEILQEIQPTNILGIDEHTALIIDAKENLLVEGLGQVTVINQNETQNFKKEKLLENTETKQLKHVLTIIKLLKMNKLKMF